MKKTKRINVVYDPLHMSVSLVCRGGSLTQVHNAEENEYVPDRELTPLVLVPEVYITDPNGIITNGKVTLSGVMWYAMPKEAYGQIQNLSYLSAELSQYLISSVTEGYTVNADGSLTVECNIEYQHPVVLLLTANFGDPRSGNVLRVQASTVLSTTSLAVAASLTLDKPASFTFDPLADSGLRTIRAALRFGGKDPDPDYCSTAYWWYKVIDGQESLVDPEDDLFYVSGQNTANLVVDPRYVDDRIHLVCKAEYALNDDELPSEPTTGCLSAETTLLRHYADYEMEHVVYGGVQVAAGTRMVKNECYVTVGKKVLSSASQFFCVKWTITKAVTGAEPILLGYGDSIMIDAKEFENGADLTVEIEELRPLKAMAVGDDVLCIDGKVLTL